MKQLLIIEDSVALLEVLKEELKAYPEVVPSFAKTLAEANRIIENTENLFDCAIVDYSLPDGLNGESILLTLQNSIPTIVFTARMDSKTRSNFLASGAADYVIKQYNFSSQYVIQSAMRIMHNPQLHVVVSLADDALKQRITSLLSIQKFKVSVVDSPAEVLDICKNDVIHIAILDQDGMYDPCQLVKELKLMFRGKSFQILAVAESTDHFDTARFLKSGADEVLNGEGSQEEIFCRISLCADRIEEHKRLENLNAEKNRFLGIAAHDIRGPVGSISSALKLLGRPNTTEGKRQKMYSMIDHSCQHVMNLIGDLLDIATIESGQLKVEKIPYDLTRLVTQRVEIYLGTAEPKNIEIKVDAPKTAMAEIDPLRITQVCDNLISNAIKYSPQDTQIDINITAHQDHFELSFTDQGPGIPEEDIQDLFKAFTVTTNKTTGGESSHGLGLHIVRKIVDSHQGTIHYKPNQPNGSVFLIDLPK